LFTTPNENLLYAIERIENGFIVMVTPPTSRTMSQPSPMDFREYLTAVKDIMGGGAAPGQSESTEPRDLSSEALALLTSKPRKITETFVFSTLKEVFEFIQRYNDGYTE